MEEAAGEAVQAVNSLPNIQPKHFVLVHGAGHGAWCWFKLRHLLEVAGNKVTCLDLAGAGIDLSDPSSILTFQEYNKPLFDFMSALPIGHKVILVGHSAGGLSLSHSLQNFGDKIEVAIFIAGTMLPSGFCNEEDVKAGLPDFSEYGDICITNFSLGRDKPPTSVVIREDFQRKLFYQLSPIEVGRRIRSLTKHPKPRIQTAATDLFKFWKNLVIDETRKKEKKCISDDRNPSKSEVKPAKSGAIKIENSPNVAPPNPEISASTKSLASRNRSKTETVKFEKAKSASAAYERNNEVEAIKVERTSNEEKKKTTITKKPSIPIGPPKLTSMIRCNDGLRDKIRELLLQAFSKVPAEATVDDRDEVRNNMDEINASDPIRVAVTVESAMFEKIGLSNGKHKAKYRSIMFNLKDSNNTDLRRRVLLGHIMPEKLINMTAEEMASDERKLSNKQIQEKALFECERGGAPKATTDQFKCGKCGERKCTYYQLQTRSADEPMTTFVTCVNCNNRWKFC